MFDETTETCHIFQLTLVIQYLNKDLMREDLISFIDVITIIDGNLKNDIEPTL